ncbi:MAG: methyltransferase [Firmicutes bacterium]|nr:methyltransferase [Bacillota bacterium]
MENLIAEGEELYDLQVNGLKILQHPQKYCFTTDPIVLANFARVRRRKVLDLGSGSGIIAILCAGKYGASRADGIELQADLCDMSRRSAAINGLGDKTAFYNFPMQESELPPHSYDAVISNPPFNRLDDGDSKTERHIAVCRHELAVTLDEVVAAAAYHVKYGGRLYMIHQTERLHEVFCALNRHGFEAKRLRLIQGRTGIRPTLALIDAGYKMKPGLEILHNLVLYDDRGRETEELRRIYN